MKRKWVSPIAIDENLAWVIVTAAQGMGLFALVWAAIIAAMIWFR